MSTFGKYLAWVDDKNYLLYCIKGGLSALIFFSFLACLYLGGAALVCWPFAKVIAPFLK